MTGCGQSQALYKPPASLQYKHGVIRTRPFDRPRYPLQFSRNICVSAVTVAFFWPVAGLFFILRLTSDSSCNGIKDGYDLSSKQRAFAIASIKFHDSGLSQNWGRRHDTAMDTHIGANLAMYSHGPRSHHGFHCREERTAPKLSVCHRARQDQTIRNLLT